MKNELINRIDLCERWKYFDGGFQGNRFRQSIYELFDRRDFRRVQILQRYGSREKNVIVNKRNYVT